MTGWLDQALERIYMGRSPGPQFYFLGGGARICIIFIFFFFLINAVFTNIVIYVEFIGLNHASWIIVILKNKY